MRATIRALMIAAVCVGVLGCSSADKKKAERREAYLDADYYQRLQLPPDLTDASFDKELIVPEPAPEARQRFQRQTSDLGEDEAEEDDESPTAAAPVASGTVVLAGAALQRDGDSRWLVVDADAGRTWDALQQFLLEEGVPVARQEPQIGMIETDWVVKYRIPGDEGFFAGLFSKFEPDHLDRFVFRIEQAPATGSRVYVSHSMKERMVQGDDSNWVTRGADAAIEAEMLQRFALYVGAAGSSVSRETYRPFAVRVRPSEFDANSIEIVGDAAHARKRLLAALGEIGVQEIREAESGAIVIGLDHDNAALTSSEQEDEIAQSSFLMQWLRGGDDEQPPPLTLKLTELDHHTRLDLLDDNGELSDGVLAEQLSDRLLNELL